MDSEELAKCDALNIGYKGTGYPKNKEEWWQLCTRWKTALRRLVCTYHPAVRYGKEMKHRITNKAAEAACEVVREEIRKGMPDLDPVAVFDDCFAKQDANMAVLLSSTWFGMPESVDVRREIGFGVLCDLCSEADVLDVEFPGD